jgi:cytidine deaminase
MSRNAGKFAHVELLASTERRAAANRANGTAESAAMSADDLAGLNPLRPCGACKEWLNKIAEVNPGFRVVMFSDVTCDEVYVKEVGQC